MVHAPPALTLAGLVARGLLALVAACSLPALAQSDRARTLLQGLEAVVAREPGHVGAIYTAAKVAASIGDAALAFAWLDRLAPDALGDELDPDDFPALLSNPAYRERAARFARAAPPVGRAHARELECRDLLPEGTAWDAKRGELLLSSGRERTVFALDARGRCRTVAPPGDAGLQAVLGMAADRAGDSLWVAATAAPFMREAKPGEGGAMLARIDLARGRVAAIYRLEGDVLLNDLARASDGAIYATESRGGTIYRLAPGASALTRVLPAESLESPNGIVVLATGDLLVADFHGLARVRDPATAHASVERLASGVYLGGIDGLATDGRRIVAIQNLVGLGRVWLLDVDLARRSVGARLLLRGHPDFRNPTTGVLVGEEFRFLADPRLQAADPATGVAPLPEGRTGYRLLSVPLGTRRPAAAIRKEGPSSPTAR